jgi:exosortase family protein XrtF
VKMLQEFKPTIIFLVKFVVLYVAGNLLYGLYVTQFHPRPDPATRFAAEQTSFVLHLVGWDTETEDANGIPNTMIKYGEHAILLVYEGCNGLNVAILFLAFLLSFGPISKTLLWFIPLGLMLIHLANLTRITLLFYVASYWPKYMYFTHKYLFTAILFVVVFALWVWWVRRYSLKKEVSSEK